MVGASLLILVGLGPLAISAQGQGEQKIVAPKWLDDSGKDLFTDIAGSATPFDEATCEQRESLLKSMMGHSEPEASHYRYSVLRELGVCEMIKANYDKAKKRIDSAVSELNLPNDDMVLTNQDLAPTGLLREASKFMAKYELTQAATALRRSKEISERNLKKIIKMIHKQMSQQGQGGGNAPPVDKMVDEIPGLGKTGQFLPMLMGQAPMLKQEMGFYEQVDKMVESVEKQLAGFVPAQKAIRKTLDTSKGSKGGTLMYVRGLVTESVSAGERMMVVDQLNEEGVIKSFQEECKTVEKSLTLLKRSKQGSGCKEGKGMDKTCKALEKIPDLKSNVFGETRVVVVKPGKKQSLEVCSTNANVGILIAAIDGVSLKVGESTSELSAGLPVVVDFCQEVTLEAKAQTAVLFGQAWHPEYAAVERTGEIRSRSKTFDLAEDEVKAATKVVNDFAKKNWEKAGKQWRENSEIVKAVHTSLTEAKDAAKKEAEDAAEAKKIEFESQDDTRKKDLEVLEEKRAAKKKKAEALEQKRKDRLKQLEDERANRDPWLNTPEVLEVEKNLAELKEARRDANAKLEFDLTSQLTKDIGVAERLYKKTSKAAKKAYKKAGGKMPEKAPASEPVSGNWMEEKGKDKKGKKEEKKDDKADDKKADKIADVKKKLEDVKTKKKKAAEDEDFAAAKTLKASQKDLEDQLKKLEL